MRKRVEGKNIQKKGMKKRKMRIMEGGGMYRERERGRQRLCVREGDIGGKERERIVGERVYNGKCIYLIYVVYIGI